jgi:hypothetical protein
MKFIQKTLYRLEAIVFEECSANSVFCTITFSLASFFTVKLGSQVLRLVSVGQIAQI